jgi:hypothetical protein
MRPGPWGAAAALTLLPLAAAAQERRLVFSDGGWQIDGRSSVATVDGRQTLVLEQGVALRKDAVLQDGVVEFDVKLTRRRSFVYVTVRMEGEGEHEEFYLRPHKSGLPDAVQYAPVFQGQSGWQLYHGPGATASVDFEPGAWTHVKVMLDGRRAALVVDGVTAVVVPRLAREPRPGYIGLRSFLPPGTPGTEPIARFANVVVRPGPVAPAELPAAPSSPAPSTDRGLVRAWGLSDLLPSPPPLPASPVPPTLPATLRTVETEPEGFVNLHRHVRLAAGARAGTAAARIRVRTDREGTRALDLGFSDIATVFVNGRPVFTGDQRYSYDAPRRDGLLGFDQARVYLPLRAGDNEVVVVVSDSFGGWAVMGRFPDPDGITVDAQ